MLDRGELCEAVALGEAGGAVDDDGGGVNRGAEVFEELAEVEVGRERGEAEEDD